jgi:hypothetical protein
MRVPAGAKWLMALIWAHKKKKAATQRKEGLVSSTNKIAKSSSSF